MSDSHWAQEAEQKLAGSGRKRGGARSAVVGLLAGQPCTMTAIEIEQELRGAGGRPVSRASIYRILQELEELGLVARVDTGQPMGGFERVCDHEQHHHHLVCESCGSVTPFSDAALERAIEQLSERVPLAVHEHEIVLRGACRACRG
jgi:Fur family ferric uptake transcriptional regulator